MKASSISVKLLATALVIASTTGVAFAKNYKGESNYKDMKDMPVCPPPVMLKDGFYLGAQVGYDSMRVRESVGSGNLGLGSGSTVLNNTGWMGGLFLGYGQYLTDLFYLGGEIFGNVNGSSINSSATTRLGSFNGKFTNNGNYGLALVPGLRLNDTSLGYIKLGWNWASLKGSGTFMNPAGVTLAHSSSTKTANGFDFGIGIETLLMTNWSVRTEFNHTWYNSFNHNLASFNPSDNQFTLGLLYHFS